MAELEVTTEYTYVYSLDTLKATYPEEWQEFADDFAEFGGPDERDSHDFVIECFYGEGLKAGDSSDMFQIDSQDETIYVKSV